MYFRLCKVYKSSTTFKNRKMNINIMADAVVLHLKEWLVRFFKNKDLVFRKMDSLEENDDSFQIKYKDGRIQRYDIHPVLTKEVKVGDDSIVCLNSKENFSFFKENWQSFIQHKNLSVYFLNPFSRMDKKWVIFPYMHNRITEGDTKHGLDVLFSNVNEISYEEIKKILK